MAIIRVEHDKINSHITVPRNVLEDQHLSWGAKGLYVYLLSFESEKNFTLEELEEINGDAKSLLRELQDKKYIECLK